MTGHFGTVLQQRVMDMIHEAEHHRRTHAEQLDRLGGRWTGSTSPPAAAIGPAPATNDRCH